MMAREVFSDKNVGEEVRIAQVGRASTGLLTSGLKVNVFFG
jgi:hypothetical protein